MTQNDERELLRAALERPAGCPPLERLIDAAFADHPTAEQRALLAHATGDIGAADTASRAACPACSAELELARAFDGAARNEGEASEISWIDGHVDVAAGRKAASGAAPMARVLPMRRPAKRSSTAGPSPAWTRYAAAALVLVGLGVAVRWNATPRPPALPDGPLSDVVRGGEITLDSPVGELPAEPSQFAWRPVAGATSYRLEVRDVAGDLLFSGESREPAFGAPADLGALLESRVAYSWLVIARDAAGAELARSSPAIFRFEAE